MFRRRSCAILRKLTIPDEMRMNGTETCSSDINILNILLFINAFCWF
jgi:hypothetical protein